MSLAQDTVATEQGLVIVGCSRRKIVTSAPVPAMTLYQGACIPQIRQHFAADPERRSRVRILSAAHGLLRPEYPVATYDEVLTTTEQATDLHHRTVSRQLELEFRETPALRHLIIAVEPRYLVALLGLYSYLDRLRHVSITPNPRAWQDGLRPELRRWGWA